MKSRQEIIKESVLDFDKYWTYELPLDNRVITLKKLSFPQRIYLRLWKRFQVKSLYFWANGTWSQQNMMPFPFPLKHDGFTLSSEVEKEIPRGFQMKDNWTISASALKYLRRGPLISESGETILVQPYSFGARWFLRTERYLAILGSIASIIGLVYVFT